MNVLSSNELARIKELAGVLLPAASGLPAATAVKTWDALILLAIKASAISVSEISAAVAGLPQQLDLKTARAYAAAQPAMFELLTVITSGAYVMAPEVLGHLGFPSDRRNPAGQMDAADEYETGILEPVVGRGPVFRDPRRS